MTNDKNGIAQVDKPVQLTWRNRRVKTRENDGGVFFLVEVEVDEESWGFLKTIPRNASGEMVVWVTEIGMITEKPKKERKQKDPKGPFSFMWEYLHPNGRHEGRGFVSLPGVREAILDARYAETEDIWKILHRLFDAETLATIGPDAVLAKFPDNPPVKLAVDRAMKFQQDKEAKPSV
jgi:hypothetical protein